MIFLEAPFIGAIVYVWYDNKHNSCYCDNVVA